VILAGNTSSPSPSKFEGENPESFLVNPGTGFIADLIGKLAPRRAFRLASAALIILQKPISDQVDFNFAATHLGTSDSKSHHRMSAMWARCSHNH
jgi:hypothetical protein